MDCSAVIRTMDRELLRGVPDHSKQTVLIKLLAITSPHAWKEQKQKDVGTSSSSGSIDAEAPVAVAVGVIAVVVVVVEVEVEE